jgi:hypothetical protein
MVAYGGMADKGNEVSGPEICRDNEHIPVRCATGKSLIEVGLDNIFTAILGRGAHRCDIVKFETATGIHVVILGRWGEEGERTPRTWSMAVWLPVPSLRKKRLRLPEQCNPRSAPDRKAGWWRAKGLHPGGKFPWRRGRGGTEYPLFERKWSSKPQWSEEERDGGRTVGGRLKEDGEGREEERRVKMFASTLTFLVTKEVTLTSNKGYLFGT